MDGSSRPVTVPTDWSFDHRLADCSRCPLGGERASTMCLSQRPSADAWSGLMLVGEGPGETEARLKTPFIGASGKLLDSLLEAAGIDRRSTLVTNATLCQPSYVGMSKRSLMETFADAVPACRSRLFAEIYHWQPRVIVALGQAALAALTGQEETRQKRVPFDCAACGNLRKWKVWGCPKCDWQAPLPAGGPTTQAVDKAGQTVLVPVEPSTRCACSVKGRPTKIRVQTVECKACDGLKTRAVDERLFFTERNITEVAGGVWPASMFRDVRAMLTRPGETFIIPTYHPSFLLRGIETKGDKVIGGQFLAAASLAHLRKARRLLSSGPQWTFRWRTVTTVQDFVDYVVLHGRDADYALDIETDSKEALAVRTIKCVGLNASSTDESIVLDTEGRHPHDPLVLALGAWLTDPAYRKTLQNGLYDTTVLEHVWGFATEGVTFDTMLAHKAVAPDEPHDLSHIVFTHSDAPPWKPAKKRGGEMVWASKEELHEYNGRDCRATSVARSGLEAALIVERTRQVHDLDVQKIAVARSMTLRGMALDRREALQLAAEAQYEAEQALFEMRKLAGRPPVEVLSDEAKKRGEETGVYFSPSSTQQLVWALFSPDGPCKLHPSAYTDSAATRGKMWQTASTDKTALLAFVGHPFVDQLRRYRNRKSEQDFCTTGLPLGADMRIHPYWYPSGARSGRWTSSPNFQNVSKGLRSMIVAPEGRAFVGADSAQIELRIVAALAGDRELISRCKNAVESRKLEPECDPHSWVASLALGTAYTALSLADPTHDKALAVKAKCKCETCTRKHLRDVIKRMIYGVNYGAGPETVLEAIYDGGYDGPPISLDILKAALRAYFTLCPDVARWCEAVVVDAQRTGYVREPVFGRMRCFPLRQVSPTEVRNFPIQASAAAIIDASLLRLEAALPSVDPSAFIFAQVHDALYVECDEARAPEVARTLEASMSCEVQLVAGADWMPLPASAQIAKNWKEAA